MIYCWSRAVLFWSLQTRVIELVRGWGFVDGKSFFLFFFYFKLPLCFLTHSELSCCHPARQPFTSRMSLRQRQWKQPFSTRSFLGMSQPIGEGLQVHLTLFLAGDSQSQRFQHTWCIVVCLLVIGCCGPLHRCRGSGPFFWPPANQIHCFIGRRVEWQPLGARGLSCECTQQCISTYTCIRGTPLPHSHNALRSYQQASLILLLATSSRDSTIGTVLPP